MARRSVLIVGCGIAGPALAYWLLQQGFEVTIAEKAPELRREGYAIDFWGLGYDLVDRMGLLPQVLEAGHVVRELRLVNSRGRRVGGFDVDVFRAATNGRFTTLPRAALSAILHGAIADRAAVRWGTTPIGFEQRADGVLVRFSDETSELFHCVVGADGAHSTVREQLFGDSREFERYLGFRVVAFQVPGYPRRDELAYVSYADPGRQMARLGLADDRTLFLLMAREEAPGPAHWERRATLDYLLARFGDMGWEAPDILSAAGAASDIYIDRVSQVRLPRWWRGRVALVGDAAYAPSLLAGQGSALAIIGAYVLAGELARAVTPEGAFERYQGHLQGFLRSKQEAATKFAGTFIPQTRWGIWARNIVTRAMAIPLIAKLAMGDSLTDALRLPEYPLMNQKR
ncbi:MAG TPA: FAD-dependent monooxygenase [Polyangiaceae bacterium]|nr:FAD-dependent monooxygenase [Polyangiaceae bacterium]